MTANGFANSIHTVDATQLDSCSWIMSALVVCIGH